MVSVLDGLRRSRAWVQNAVATLSGNSLVGKLFTPIVPLFTKQRNLRVARVTAGVEESDGCLPSGL